MPLSPSATDQAAAIIADPQLAASLIAERRAAGGDRFDEVWNATYVMSPLADFEHQRLATDLAVALSQLLVTKPGSIVVAGVNVSDRDVGWTQNYRCPDLAVLLPGSRAKDCGTHLCGGPDFLIEIASDYDHSRDKLDFYAAVGVRELLIIDRDPWRLELYRESSQGLMSIGGAFVAEPPLTSETLELTFQLTAGVLTTRPSITLQQPASGRRLIV